MKKKPRHLRSVAQGPDVVFDVDAMNNMDVRSAFIVRFGPQCAAWLCNRFRRQIRRRGSFLVHVPVTKQLPAWADIALSYLKKRDRWDVEEEFQKGNRYFRVTWKRRHTPLSLLKHPSGVPG